MSNDEPERFAPPRPNGVRTARIDIERSVTAVRDALEAMRFGSITVTVHDARVVQLDVTEKTRFTA